MTRFLTDIRLAARSLRRSPTFTLVAVTTLALGIGANAAIFSVVNGVLLKPLDYPDSDNLLSVNFTAPGLGYELVPFDDSFYLRARDELRTLESVGMSHQDNVNLIGDGDPIRVAGANVTASVFEVLRVPAALGRLFNEEDGRPGAEPVAILSYQLWQERYGGDPAVLDRIEDMDGVMRRIVGVMPAGFAFPSAETSLWKPYILDEANPVTGSFSNPGIGRMAPGASVETVNADVTAMLERTFADAPDDWPQALVEQARFGPRVQEMKELMVGDVRQALLVILGTVGMVLLIACANVANLFLVRSETRQREVTLRAALGAGRGDVVRFFLAESLMLSLAGGVVGVLVAFVAVRSFTTAEQVAIPRLSSISVDASVLAFTLGISLLTGLVFGIAPMLRRETRDLAAALRAGGRSVTVGHGLLSARSLLVVTQVALALVLLVGAGLMVRSFSALRNVDPGFRPDGVLATQLTLGGATYPDARGRLAFWRSLRERAQALPGVVAVGAISQLPLSDQRNAGSYEIEGFDSDEEGVLPPLAEKKMILPGFFETLGVPLIAGRYLEDTDGADGFRGVVVSESLAAHWWPNESALGKRLREDEEEIWWEIVGVVGDLHYASLEQPAEEVLYWPTMIGTAEQPFVSGGMELVIRTTGTTSALTGPLREQLRQIDARLPIARSRALASLVSDSMARTSFTVVMLGIASSIALLLGAIGIYGVISYVVSQRVQEIGVRIALGATRGSVQGMVVRRGMLLAGIGIAVGLGGALAAGSTLSSLLYEIDAADPTTYLVVAAILGATALFASWLPALRASGVDPVEALRD